MKLKPFLLFIGVCALLACASAQKEDEMPARVEKDPAVTEQTKINEKLASQSAAKMAKTLKVPSITYEFDSVRPPEEAYPILDKIATVMTEAPTLHLIIEGHADVVGSAEYNYWLSAARASAMKSYLVSRGIAADRIRIHAYGKDRPITLDNSSAGRRANRRVEFTFTKRNWQSIY